MSQVFVGRDEQVKRAGELLEATLSGTESVYCVEGAPGIGKTALMQRIVETCRRRGFAVLNGSFVDGQDLPPLWPWRRILAKVKNVVNIGHRELIEKHAALFTGIESSWDEIKEMSELPVTDRKFRFFEMIGGCLADLAESVPISIVIDDLHTGDDLSLHLLQYLLDDLELSRVFALLSWRPGEGSGIERITKLKEKVFYLPNAYVAALEPFGHEELSRVLAAFSLEPSDAEANHLLQWTKGLPLQIQLYAERLHSVSLEHPIRESTVSELFWLTARKTLSDEAVRTLELLALVGNGFSEQELAALIVGPSAGRTVIDEMLETGAIQRSADSELFSFLHDELRKAILATIPESERKSLLYEAAERIEETGFEDARHVWLLKELFFALDDHSSSARKTIYYALQAAHQSISQNAWPAVCSDLERLLSHWTEAMTDEELRSVQFDLCAAYEKTFKGTLGAPLFQELWRYFWEREDLERLIDLVAIPNYSGIYSAVDLGGYPAMLLEKLSANHPRRCEVFYAHGQYLREVRGKFEQGRREMEEAIVGAVQTKNRRLEVLARFQLAVFDVFQRRFSEALETAQELLEQYGHQLDASSMMGTHIAKALALLGLGRMPESRAVLEQASKRAVLYENPSLWLTIVGMIQRFELRAGNWDGIRSYEQREPETLVVQFPRVVADYLTGDFAGADGYIESLFEMQSRYDEARIRMSDPVVTWLLAIRGYLTRDGQWLGECRMRIDRAGGIYSSVRYLADYSISAARIAPDGLSSEEAKEYYERLRKAEEYFFEEEEYSIAAARALLALRWGDSSLAIRHFEEAIAFCDKYEERPWRAHYLFELAQLLPPAEEKRTERLVEEAASEARRLGLRPLLSRMEREGSTGVGGKRRTAGASAGGQPLGASEDPSQIGGITRREREILQCLVEGLTDKEIAASLNISPYTVGNHLRNIYAKTQSANRGEAAHWAISTGVIRVEAADG